MLIKRGADVKGATNPTNPLSMHPLNTPTQYTSSLYPDLPVNTPLNTPSTLSIPLSPDP